MKLWLKAAMYVLAFLAIVPFIICMGIGFFWLMANYPVVAASLIIVGMFVILIQDVHAYLANRK